MGRVFRARDVRLGRFVALKVLAPSLSEHRDSLLRLRREAQTASALNHPALVTIFDIGDTPGGEIFIAMELIDGANLRQWVREPRTIPDVLEAIAQAAEGLAAAHDSGVIHRDIKPDNIMVSRLGFAKVVDFGLAKSTAALAPSSPDTPTEMRTEQGLIVGTVAYMSPEQLRGETLDGACDVFALGCALQEVVAGRAPFAASSRADTIARILEGRPDALPSTVDPRLAALIGAMLDKERQRRPSMRSVSAELRAITRSSDATSSPTSPMVRPPGRLMRKRVLVAAAVVAIVAASTIGVMWHRSRPTGDPSRPTDPAVADLYSRAQVFAGTPEWTQQDLSVPLLEEVVKRDPKFLPARLELAKQYARKAFALDPDRTWEQKAFVQADQILEIDPEATLPHLIRAQLLWTKAHGFPHERAIAETDKVLSRSPDDVDALEERGSILLHVGLLDEALADYTRALKSQPNDPETTMRVGRIHLFKGDYPKALQYLQQYTPDNYQIGIAMICMGRDADAQLFLDGVAERKEDKEDTASVRALLLARRGQRAAAEETIAQVVATGGKSSHFHHAMYVIAETYAQMHDAEKSVYWLGRTSNEGMPAYPYFARDPLLDPIRSDPRFVHFLNDSRAAFEARKRAIAEMLAK